MKDLLTSIFMILKAFSGSLTSIDNREEGIAEKLGCNIDLNLSPLVATITISRPRSNS